MKKKNLYALLAAGVLLAGLPACSKDDEPEEVDDPEQEQKQEQEPETTVTYTFEDVQLGEDGVWDGSDMTGGLSLTDEAWFNCAYVADYGGYSNGGFAFSNQTDRQTAGYTNQYSVYADGGANGSEVFAVVYYSSFGADNSYVSFKDAVRPKSVYLNNSTYAYLSVTGADNQNLGIEDGGWFKVVFSGLDAAGTQTGSVEYYLADYRDGKTYVCSEWTRVDLTPLGTVSRVQVSVDGSKVNDYGLLWPAYVCLDDLVVAK